MTVRKPGSKVVATVLGAGTMGAGIAAHLAAAGCKTHLLDIVPSGVSSSDPVAKRSAIAQGAIRALAKARPPALMSEDAAGRIVPGNLEDDLARAVGESDLVIEAVVERLDVKTALFKRVFSHAGPDAIVATNTSGIPIAAIARELPEDARARFLGLHFFNPPRWMHLLEVISGPDTSPAVAARASDFCDRVLGKGVVPCRDTPNFIGNRVGIVEMLLTFRAAAELGLTVEEVDFLNGPLLGRPKTGSFRLGDLVGIDVLAHVVRNLESNLSADPGAANFDPLYPLMKVPAVIDRLVAEKRLGDKTGSGFYKKSKDPSGKSVVLSLSLDSLDYREPQPADFPELAKLSKLLELEPRVSQVLRSEGKGGEFLRRVAVPLMNYAASLVGVICETPREIDDAMRWGYGWELGPLELLDAAGLEWVRAEVARQGGTVAPLLDELHARGLSKVYGGTRSVPTVFVPGRGETQVPLPDGMILLDRLRDSATLKENRSASLIDLGDGIACLEFRSKANILDDGVVALIAEAPTFLAERGFRGLVVGNQADHFCRGANLMAIAGMIAQKKWGEVEAAVRSLQDAFMGLRHGPIPVVAAPLGQTLGGGTEVCLHCHEIQAGADLFMGLVELGVGVLPAGGGLKEIARRASAWADQLPAASDPYHFVRRGFEAVAQAKVSGSAFEAKQAGFLAPSDGITFHKRRVIADAKSRALALAIRGYEAPDRDEPIRVAGTTAAANLSMGVRLFGWGGYASDHDMLIGRKVVHVLTGGGLPEGATTTAQHLLDLEREAFVSLTAEPKTFERIQFMLQNKKPLRN